MYHECRHIFTSGKKCQSPALRDQPFCYFHSNTRKKPAPAHQPYDPYTDPKESVLALTQLEDSDAIQLALSEVVLALAANRIDPRRARILIYGLQVASLNHRHSWAIEDAEDKQGACPERSRRVRETHRHADGTLIGPEKQTPDAEEIEEQEAPSLGRILVREVQKMKQEKAEKEARLKAEAAAKAAQQSFSFQLDQLHAVADSLSKRCHPERSTAKSKDPQRSCADRLAQQGPHFTSIPMMSKSHKIKYNQGVGAAPVRT